MSSARVAPAPDSLFQTIIRLHGHEVQFDPSGQPLSKQLARAANATFVIIVAPDEWNRTPPCVVVRDMAAREQRVVERTGVVKFLHARQKQDSAL